MCSFSKPKNQTENVFTASHSLRLAQIMMPNGMNNTNINIRILYDATLAVLTCHCTLQLTFAPLV